eukprot:XP_011664616.1 PREDICTED: alpha-2,8-sialyltransferase 8B-like [Strongylocentrotus purpuratus]
MAAQNVSRFLPVLFFVLAFGMLLYMCLLFAEDTLDRSHHKPSVISPGSVIIRDPAHDTPSMKTAPPNLYIRDKVSKIVRPWEIIQIYKRSIEPEDFDFEVNETLIRRHNKTESLPEQQTCAVVGNSGILSDSNCGRAIDSHDYIYRMNLAPFGQEYGKDVGYRTNITTLNYSQLKSMAKCAKKRFAKMSPARALMLTNMKLYNHSVIWYPKGGSRKGNMNALSRGMKDIFNFTAGWAYSPVSLFGAVPRYYVINNAKNMEKKGTKV